MEFGGKIWDDAPNSNTWYRFMETDGQKRAVFDGNLIPKRDSILDSFSTKFKNQSPWGAEDMEQTGKGGVNDAVMEILNFWKLDSLDFHLILEDKLRQSKTSYQSKKLKLHYQKTIRMATTALSDLPSYKKYTEEGGTHETLPMSIVTDSVNSFGALYDAVFTSVYSRQSKAKLTQQAAKQCITKCLESFLGLAPFTQLTLFDEGDTGAHDLCNKVARTMKGGSSLDNWNSHGNY